MEDLKQLEEKFTEVDLRCTVLSKQLQGGQGEALAQRSKDEELVVKQKATETKAEGFKAKFNRMKKQLRHAKEKAQNYFKQLSFASWTWDQG